MYFSYLNSISYATQIIFVSLLALALGSFASVVTFRIRKKDSEEDLKNLSQKTSKKIVFSRSKCVNCGIVLKVKNLIPIFSWIWQLGKCSNCKAKISIRYPIIEVVFLLAFLVVYYALDQVFDWKMLIYFLMIGLMIVMCIFDLEQYFIPNFTQYLITALVSILLIIEGGFAAPLHALFPAFCYLGFGLAIHAFFYFATSIKGIGTDDFKFFFIAGLLLGMSNLLLFMILSGLFGSVIGAIWQKIKQDDTFPFAPAICLSSMTCLLLEKGFDPVDVFGSILFFQNF